MPIKITFSPLVKNRLKLRFELSCLKEIVILDIDSIQIEMQKKIPGYDGYFASKKGSILSNKQGSMKIMKSSVDGFGYLRTGLRINGNSKRIFVHILVAKTFIPNPKKYPFVNHKDGNRRNNCVTNLEWVTHKQNMVHSLTVLKANRFKRSVCQMNQDGSIIKKFDSIKDASNETSVRKTGITRTCQGKNRKAGNYLWWYEEDYSGQTIRKYSRCKTVNQMDLDGNFIRSFESIKSASAFVGDLGSGITSVCKGHKKTCKGYKWEYGLSISHLKEKVIPDWGTTDNYPKYKISNCGEVFSIKHKRLRRLATNRAGYKRVSFKSNISTTLFTPWSKSCPKISILIVFFVTLWYLVLTG